MTKEIENLIKTNDLKGIYLYAKQHEKDISEDDSSMLANALLSLASVKGSDIVTIANALFILGWSGSAYKVAQKTKNAEAINILQKLAIESEDSDIIINFARQVKSADKKAMIFYMLRNDMYTELADFALEFEECRNYIIDILEEEKDRNAQAFNALMELEDKLEQQEDEDENEDELSDQELGIDWDSIY